MSLLSKMKTALRILRQEGFLPLMKVVKKRLTSTSGIDEVAIIVQALDATKIPGVMVDVGAHYGGALEPFARSGWQVYAFEPDSENRQHLVNTFGSFANVNIDKRAIADKPQEGVTFYKSNKSTGISGLSAFHPSHKAGEKVDITTLKDFFAEKKLANTKVDFLKIDTEGYDLFALKGFPWQQGLPKVILCEFEDSKTKPLGYDFHDLSAFLQENGYKLLVSEWHPIKNYGETHAWRRFVTYPCELADPQGWGNIIAVQPTQIWEAVLRICGLK